MRWLACVSIVVKSITSKMMLFAVFCYGREALPGFVRFWSLSKVQEVVSQESREMPPIASID
jgi:hypothetical protein